jgi:hypothetical protein
MATKKASKSTKQLRKAKKLEATKPLSNCCQGTHIKQVTIEM